MQLRKIILPDSRIVNRLFYIFVGIVTLIMIISMSYLDIDSDVTKLLPENKDTLEERAKIDHFKSEFPSSDSSIFLAVEVDEITKDKLAHLRQMCNELENLVIDGEKIVSSILSPFNAVYFKKVGSTFIPQTVFSGSNPNVLQRNLEDIEKNRYIIGSVLSYDKKSIGILVNMNEDAIITDVHKKNIWHYIGEKFYGKNYEPKKLDRNRFSAEIENVYASYYQYFNIYTAGLPIYEAKSRVYMLRDILALFIPAIIMMILVLFLNFRSFRGVLLPLTGMLLSVVWTLGLMSLLRQPLNVVGILIPPLILTVGSSYTLHYLNSYYLHSAEKDKRKVVVDSSKAIFPTISMAALTTIIGFASFFTARMASIRSFGFWIVISIGFTLFFTFFLLSKLLVRIEVPDEKRLSSVRNDYFSVFLRFVHKIVTPNYVLWIMLFVFAILLFAGTVKNIKIETNAVNFFKQTDPVKQSMMYMQKNYRGTMSFNVTISAKNGEPNFFRSVEGLKIAEELENYLEANPGVDGEVYTGWRMSPVAMLQDINLIMNGERAISEDQALVDRFYNLVFASKPANSSIINKDLSAINFQIRTYSHNEKASYSVTEQEVAKLNAEWKEAFRAFEEKHPEIVVDTWGEMLLLSKVSKYLYEDQIGSLSFTVLFILITTLILFRSIYYAFISTISLLFGVFMNFSIMSIFNISLDVATIMIGAISVSVGIDSSLHFILNYRRILRKGESTEKLGYALTYTSRPILFTSLALIAGFLVFLFSTFRPVSFLAYHFN